MQTDTVVTQGAAPAYLTGVLPSEVAFPHPLPGLGWPAPQKLVTLRSSPPAPGPAKRSALIVMAAGSCGVGEQ